MNIETYIKQPFMGGTVTGIVYRSLIPTNNWVLFLHGIGEVGPSDGSNLREPEKLGWPGMAAGKRPWADQPYGKNEYPFNIFLIQAEKSYSGILKTVLAYMIYALKAKNIIPVGISLGGHAVYGIMEFDHASFLKAVVCVCGKGQVNYLHKMNAVKGLHWHGDKDTIVPYGVARDFVKAYNEKNNPEGNIELITLPGVAHDAWKAAFNIDMTKDRTVQFVNEMFAASADEIPQGDYQEGVSETLTRLETFISSLKTNL